MCLAIHTGFEPAPRAHQAFHPSGVGKLVPDLSGRIKALTWFMGRPPQVIVKATYAFNHLYDT